jgi:hypothetical protein
MRVTDFASESPMEASKWLNLQALISEEEMNHLLEALGYFEIYFTGVLTRPGEEQVSKEDFLNKYRFYIEALMQGDIPEESVYRSFFNTIFTVSSDCLYAIPASNGRQLIRASKPIVQLQAHSMDYSILDGKFRSMVFGLDSILWGLQFSYPQLYLDPETKEILTIADNEMFPNTALFKKLQKWLRQETIPTPFQVGSNKINVPIRLGKKCLGWINKHPQLLKKNLAVQYM